MRVGSNISTLADGAAAIRDGDTVGIGGYFFYRHPMALCREIIRQGKRNLTVIAPLSGVEADILIGAGCVRKIIFGFLSLDVFGMAPNFRRKVESGEVEHEDYGDLALVRSIEAASRSVPYIATRAWIGSDMLAHHPGKVIEAFGEKLLAVPALQPDIALVHCQWADTEGNMAIEGESYDVEMIAAARKVVATCEKLVSPAELRRLGKRIIPRYRIEHLIPLPFGAHPCSCFPFHTQDMRHILEYSQAAQTEEGFKSYLDRYVFGLPKHTDYLEAVGGVEKLLKLEQLMTKGIQFIRDKERARSHV
jgi:glutaconate CoA-transferase subunit A